MKKYSCFLLFVFMSYFLSATNYFVSKSGDERNPGSYLQPMGSIQTALDNTFAGDTVTVRTGVYYEALVFPNSGNTTAGYIVFRNFPGEYPVIEGSGTGSNIGLLITGKSYIEITGFEIRNWPQNVIQVEESCHHIIFNDIKAHDFGYGLTFYNGCHDITLNRVESYNYGSGGISYGFDCSYDRSQNKPNHHFVFNDCIAHGDPAATDNIDGFAIGHQTFSHWQHDFTYNHCITYDVYDGFDMDAKNTYLNGCMAYNCKNGCYKLWSDKIYLVNCLGYNAGVNCLELDYPSDLPGYRKKVSLRNCTLFGGESCIMVEHTSTDSLEMYNCIISGGKYIGLNFYEQNISKIIYKGDYNLFHC